MRGPRLMLPTPTSGAAATTKSRAYRSRRLIGPTYTWTGPRETWHTVPAGMPLEVRLMRREEVPAAVGLLADYMQETFGRPWGGSAEALARDGLGAETELVLALRETPIGFAAFSRCYDLHHCAPGSVILDLYVAPSHRGY